MGVLLVPLIAVAAVALWWADVRVFHPWRTCPSCNGKQRHKGIVRGTHGDCKRCGSTGRVRRLGARKQ